jgi:hypothetical protein
MSFANLKAAKKSSSKSFVQVNRNAPQTSEEELMDVSPSPSTGNDGMYQAIPPYLTIKTSFERGRGLWTNRDLPAGMLLCCRDWRNHY